VKSLRRSKAVFVLTLLRILLRQTGSFELTGLVAVIKNASSFSTQGISTKTLNLKH